MKTKQKTWESMIAAEKKGNRFGCRKKNRIEVSDGIATIYLSRNARAIIDAKDIPVVGQHTWHTKPGRQTSYAATSLLISRQPELRRPVYMHRLLIGEGAIGFEIDHINGDGLDNRRENLRIVTPLENKRGFRSKKIGAASKYRGVHKSGSRWSACLTIFGKAYHLGVYEKEDEAAVAWDVAAVKHLGAGCYQNFPERTSERKTIVNVWSANYENGGYIIHAYEPGTRRTLCGREIKSDWDSSGLKYPEEFTPQCRNCRSAAALRAKGIEV